MVTAIITVVGFLLGTVNSIAASIFNSTSGKAIQKRLTELRNQINKDQQLKERLQQAYNTKNADQIYAVLNSVPGGMASKVAKAEKAVKEAINNRAQASLDNNIRENEAKANEVDTYQMNAFDNITNAVNTAKWDKNKNKLKATTSNYKNKEFKYKDFYGNEKVGNTDNLLKWTYSNETVTKPTVIKEQPNTTIKVHGGK